MGVKFLDSFVIDEKGMVSVLIRGLLGRRKHGHTPFYNIVYLVTNVYIEVEDLEDLEILRSAFSDVRFFSFSRFDSEDVIFVDSVKEIANLSEVDILVLKANKRNVYRSFLLSCLLWFYSSSEPKLNFSLRDYWKCVAWTDDIEIGLFEAIDYDYILSRITFSPLGKDFMLGSIVQASKMRVSSDINRLIEAIREHEANLTEEIAAKVWLIVFRDLAFKNVRYEQTGNILLLSLSDVVAVLSKYFGRCNIEDFLWVLKLPLGMGSTAITTSRNILTLKFNELSGVKKFMRLSGLES